MEATEHGLQPEIVTDMTDSGHHRVIVEVGAVDGGQHPGEDVVYSPAGGQNVYGY